MSLTWSPNVGQSTHEIDLNEDGEDAWSSPHMKEIKGEGEPASISFLT